MQELFEIARRRASPGILVFDSSGRLCHTDEKAKEIMSSFGCISPSENCRDRTIPKEIHELCERVATSSNQEEKLLAFPNEESCYVARAFSIGTSADNRNVRCVLVLIEQVVKKRQVNWATVLQQYELTRRETEVVRLVYEGMSNREIAQDLFISEHTVKDHIKNLMRKMEVFSRLEMTAMFH